MYAVVSGECTFQRGKLLRTVVIGGAAHNHHGANVRKLPQEFHRRLLLLEAPVAPNAGLMEDVSGDNGNVRLLLFGPGHQCVEALADVQIPGVLSAPLRAGE